MHRLAIEIKERLLGKEDYEVALSVGHLASLYNYDMDKFNEAEELYLRSIAIGEHENFSHFLNINFKNRLSTESVRSPLTDILSCLYSVSYWQIVSGSSLCLFSERNINIYQMFVKDHVTRGSQFIQ